VIISPAARRDLGQIGDYIHTRNPLAAVRFIAALRRRCEQIADTPNAGAPRFDLAAGLRSFAFRRYVIFYSVADDVVRVERIIHGARDIPTVYGKPSG